MQSVLIKLVADKEEAEVAKVIDKIIRRQPGVGNRDARALGRSRWSRPENREFKITTTATATGTSLNKRFNEQNNGSARAL